MRSGRLLLLMLLPLLWGCGSLVGVRPEPSAPGLTPPSSGPVPLPGAPELPLPDTSPVEPAFGLEVDPILGSPWLRDPALQAEVRRWIESFRTREAELFRACLARMGLYRGMVEEEIRRRKLPPSLLYLPIVESWYSPDAVSWVGAAGLWQFMAPTARGMGLRVNRLVDERRDAFLATAPALAYLEDLRHRFGSWFLALAAYNGGPGRMERILRGRMQGGEGHDGLFMEIRHRLPRETQNFVPRFLAAAIVAGDPEAYGFGDVDTWGPLQFDEVTVPDATSLDVVARAAGVELARVEELNPHFPLGLTPAGETSRVRLPPGRGQAFTVAYRAIPPEERVTFVEHPVEAGETFTHIARLYGVSVADLRGANPRVEPRRMQIGQRIVVPKAPSARRASGSGGGTSEAERKRIVLYEVRAGDTLSAIAQRHRVSTEDLLRWNGLRRTSVIRPGDEVRIHLTGGTGR